jgi:DeoR/GlpR family transcriptional regulator of sugar metabolism
MFGSSTYLDTKGILTTIAFDHILPVEGIMTVLSVAPGRKRGASFRRKAILDLLRQRNFVSIQEVVEQFNVSEMTVRRDLRSLADEGLIQRTHGGAFLLSPGTAYDPSFTVRQREQAEAKRAIARCAAELIAEGDTVGIDAGTTPLEVAHALRDFKHLIVVTAHIRVAIALANSGSDIYLIGGRLRRYELSLVGGIALNMITNFHLDKAIIGASGISAAEGVTESNLDEVEMKRALIRSARVRILVLDHTKFNRVALTTVVPLDEVHYLVTDRPPAGELLTALENACVKVIIPRREREKLGPACESDTSGKVYGA